MGKDFTPIVRNGLDLKRAYNKLFSGTWEVIEASEERFFRRIPTFEEVKEIEIGFAGTKESIIRLIDDGYVVINKTIKL